MMSGSHTCTLPEDVRVDVDFTIEDGEPVVDCASIGGESLDIDRTKIDVIVFDPMKPDYSIEGKPAQISLRQYFQQQLDEVADELVQGCKDQALEDRNDERNER